MGRADARFAHGGLIQAGELLAHIAQWGRGQGWSDDISTWDDPEQVRLGMIEAKNYIAGRQAQHAQAGEARCEGTTD